MKRSECSNAGILLAAIATISSWSAHSQEQGLLEIHSMQFQPQVVVENQPFIVTVSGYNVAAFDSGYVEAAEQFMSLPNYGNGVFAYTKAYTVEVSGQIITINYDGPGACTTPATSLPINLAPQSKRFRIPGLDSGSYTVSIDYEVGCGDFFAQASTPLTIYKTEEELAYNFETPAADSTVSGVGLIRGWACFEKADYTAFEGATIEGLAFRVNDGPLETLAFSTEREDTSAVCGKTNTQSGFGKTVFWGNYQPGEHTITFFIDGIEMETRSFNIAAPEEGFLTGIQEEYVLQNFANTSKSVRIRWSEADQNFVVVEF